MLQEYEVMVCVLLAACTQWIFPLFFKNEVVQKEMKNYLCDSDIPKRMHVYEHQPVLDKSGWAGGREK